MPGLLPSVAPSLPDSRIAFQVHPNFGSQGELSACETIQQTQDIQRLSMTSSRLIMDNHKI